MLITRSSVCRMSQAISYSLENATQTGRELLLQGGIVTIPTALYMTPDGTRLFWTNRPDEEVYQLDLSVPYDFMTATHSGVSLVATSYVTNTYGFGFANGGSYIYITGTGGIVRYELPTPYDLSVVTDTGDYVVVPPSVSNIRGFHITEDGTTAYILGFNGFIGEFTLNTPYIISSLASTANASTTLDDSSTGFSISPDGHYLCQSTLYSIPYTREFYMDTPYDIANAVYTGVEINIGEATAGGFYLPDGKTFILTEGTTDHAIEYSL